jgi:hypothetical protein
MSLVNLRSVCLCLLIVYLVPVLHTVLADVNLVQPDPGVMVRLDPAVRNGEPGGTFTVDVVVDDAVDLGAFQFDLIYDASVVVVTDIVLGPFLASTGRITQPVGDNIDNVAGTVSFGAFSFGNSAGPEGPGLLATITFTASGAGISVLNLQNVIVTDTLANAQSVSVENGTVIVAVPTPASTPTMTFSPTMSATPTTTPAGMATATATAEPTVETTPTATATREAMDTSTPKATETAPPTATETTIPTATGTVPPAATETTAPAATATASPAVVETATPIATATALPTVTATNTPLAAHLSTPTGTRALLPTLDVVLPLTLTLSLRLRQTPPIALTMAELAQESSVPSSPLADVMYYPLFWLLVGMIFFLVAGYILRLLLRQRTE